MEDSDEGQERIFHVEAGSFHQNRVGRALTFRRDPQQVGGGLGLVNVADLFDASVFRVGRIPLVAVAIPFGLDRGTYAALAKLNRPIESTVGAEQRPIELFARQMRRWV